MPVVAHCLGILLDQRLDQVISVVRRYLILHFTRSLVRADAELARKVFVVFLHLLALLQKLIGLNVLVHLLQAACA